MSVSGVQVWSWSLLMVETMCYPGWPSTPLPVVSAHSQLPSLVITT
jgi:hypothetical protein